MNNLPSPHWVLTARDNGARFTGQGALPPADPAEALPRVWVDSRRRFQTVMGFGGVFTEAAGVTWQRLGPAQREAVLCDR